MTAPLPVVAAAEPCWQRIGVWGDRSCPELLAVTHCHNCPVFAAAGRRFLDAPSPPGYLDEWAERLAAPEAQKDGGTLGALVFRIADEWLALPVAVLAEVTHPRTPHRVPHRGGVLAGLVNVRGELHLCVHLGRVLGLDARPDTPGSADKPRLVVARRDTDRWVFRADEVDRVRRLADHDLVPAPPTLARATARLTRGIFRRDGRAVGLLDEGRLFDTLRERVR